MYPPTDQRDRACSLAKHDTKRALEIAQAIDDPWFRSQALAHVGRFADEASYQTILEEARKASWEAADPYEVVGSSAWRLRAMIERGALRAATAELSTLLDASRTIANPVSRLDALHLVFQAVFAVDSARRAVLGALVSACVEATHSWRARRCLSNVAVMLHRQHPDEALRVIAAMQEGRRKRQAIRRTTEGCEFDISPRDFFW